jgi:hypothetical protein
MLLRRPGLRQGGCRRAFPGPSMSRIPYPALVCRLAGGSGGENPAELHIIGGRARPCGPYQYATGIGSIKSCFRPRPALVLCVSPASLQASCQGQAAFLINKLQKCPCDGKP